MRLFFAYAVIGAFIAASTSIGFAAKLVEDGKPLGCIVVSSSFNDPLVLNAANDLASYVEQMSGALMPVRKDDQTCDGFRILIGNTKLSPINTDQITEERIGQDGFILHPVTDAVVLTGRTSRGTANAVYHFAEEVLGGHWFSAEDDGPTFPKQSTIDLTLSDVAIKPDVWWRGQFFSFMAYDQFAKSPSSFARSVLNNRERWSLYNRLWSSVAPEYGHAFTTLVPPTLFAKHPEYFPYIDYTFKPSSDPLHPYANTMPIERPGRQAGNDAFQRCLSNPNVVKLAAEGTARQFEQDSNVKYASLSANDGPWWCRCLECQAMGKNDSERNLKFVNAVAKANEAKFPDRGYVFIVYHSTLEPPAGMEVHPKLLPMFAPLMHCRFHPIGSDCPDRVEERQFIEQWSQMSHGRIASYFYTGGGPFTTPGVITMAEEMRYMRERGSIGGPREHCSLPRVNWPMLAWMEIRLMWDLDQDPVKLRRQFIEGYYGLAAADAMERVYDKIETGIRTTNLQKSWPEGHNAMIESQEFLKPIVDACNADLDKAIQSSAAEPERFRNRVQRDVNYLRNEKPSEPLTY